MKLHSDSNAAFNTVTAYGPGYIEVNRQRYEGAVAFGPEGPVQSLPAHAPTEITTTLLMQAAGIDARPADPFAALDEPQPLPAPAPGGTEVVLVGTGTRQHFLQPAVLRPLIQAGVGVEIMDTHAAARTYNILMAEGRRVIAVLLPT